MEQRTGRGPCGLFGLLLLLRALLFVSSKKWSLFPQEAGLSLETDYQMALSRRTFEDFSTALSRTSAAKSSVLEEILALRGSIKDSKDIESLTFAKTASLHFRTTESMRF